MKTKTPRDKPKTRPGGPLKPVGSATLCRLLGDCDAAMRAASAYLWYEHRDLALQLNKLSARCRIEINDMQTNSKVRGGDEPR